MFVVYLVTYNGENLSAKYYIGSTYKNNILNNNYHGTVSSKKWHKKYFSELKDNPSNFSVEILSEWNDRTDALKEELRLHIKYDVVKSDEYFNESLAQPNGFYGADKHGENNPMFGAIVSNETREKQSKLKKGKPWSEKRRLAQQNRTSEQKEITRKKHSDLKKGNKYNVGKKRTEESKKRMSDAHKGEIWSEERKKIHKDAINRPEVIEKIKQARSKQIITNEHKKAISKSLKQRWKKKKERMSDSTSQ